MANTSTWQKDENRPAGTGPMATEVKQQAKEAASGLADKARDAAATAAHTAGNVASAIGERASDATSSVGSGMKSLAGTIREKAPHSGMMGTAASSVADALETSGRYLQQHGLGDMCADVANLIRRNPFPAVFVGIGIGYLFARATSRS
jgi:hypothetical protein